jgi:hypothetical protein
LARKYRQPHGGIFPENRKAGALVKAAGLS